MKIGMDLIAQLREKTGLGMMDCKNALQESGGDIEKAIEILRKKGAQVALKRGGNTTSEGLVHAYIHAGARVGVLLEINCETDFVARTEDMKRFAQDIGMHIAAFKPLYVSPEQVDEAFLAKEREIAREQVLATGKPANMVDQIVEGKVKKIVGEICLLQQKFIKNDQRTVDEILKDLIGKLGENIRIKRFALFEVGA